jgi:integrase
MAIFKRGNVYWFHFVWNGEHVQKSTRQSNKNVARQIESAYRTKLAKGEVGLHEPRPAPTLTKAMAEFLKWSKVEHEAHPNTYRRYADSSIALLTYFKDVKIDRITPEEIEKFKTRRLADKAKKTGRRLRPATVNRELACLKAMFNFWIRAEVVARNPVSRVKFFAENNEQTRVLTFEEQEIYLAAAHQPLKDVATLMLQTGMRPEEIYRIRVENIHLEQGFLFNPYGKTKAARRRVPLNTKALEIISRRLNTAKDGYIFPGRKSTFIRNVDNAHRTTVTRAGLPHFRLYDCRHTWATRAAMSGIDLVTLAAMLGHSRIQMVLRYAHPTEQHQLDAARKLEAFNTEKAMEELQQQSKSMTVN